MCKQYKIKNSTLIDLERLQGYLKMTYDFSGTKYINYKLLRDIIRFHVKEGDTDAKNKKFSN